MVKNPPANAGDIRDAGSIYGWGRSSGGGDGNPLQYSCLENAMDRGAWWATVHRVAKSQMWLRREHTSARSLVFCICQQLFKNRIKESSGWGSFDSFPTIRSPDNPPMLPSPMITSNSQTSQNSPFPISKRRIAFINLTYYPLQYSAFQITGLILHGSVMKNTSKLKNSIYDSVDQQSNEILCCGDCHILCQPCCI